MIPMGRRNEHVSSLALQLFDKPKSFIPTPYFEPICCDCSRPYFMISALYNIFPEHHKKLATIIHKRTISTGFTDKNVN